MNDINDFYAKVSSLIEKIRTAGREQEASRLEDCIRGGATGCEILMSLRHSLKEIKKAPKMPSSLKKTIDGVIKEINKLLKI